MDIKTKYNVGDSVKLGKMEITKQRLIYLQSIYGTDRAIGANFGVTRQRIEQIRKFYNLEATGYRNDKRDLEIYTMHKEQGRVVNICRIFALSHSQVYRIIKRHKKKLMIALPVEPKSVVESSLDSAMAI